MVRQSLLVHINICSQRSKDRNREIEIKNEFHSSGSQQSEFLFITDLQQELAQRPKQDKDVFRGENNGPSPQTGDHRIGASLIYLYTIYYINKIYVVHKANNKYKALLRL